MKKIFVALMCTVFLASCSIIDAMKYSEEINEGTIEGFDKYPGMNDNFNPLQGTPFVLPDGIVITDVIVGEQNQREEEDQNDDLKITGDNSAGSH